MKFTFAIAIILSSIFSNCHFKEDELYIEAVRNSLLPEIDLILIPHRYNYLDEKWILERKPSHFTKAKVIEELKRYDRSWNEFEKENHKYFSEENGIIILNGYGISHSTHYSYDRKIPIVFYGPKYFKSNIFQKYIHQQHIVPTIASLIQSPIPIGSRENPINEILLQQTNQSKKPELVLFIVIDQGGMELYNSHKYSYPNIKKIFQNGSYFPHATVGHIDAHTAVGHVGIGTGGYPKQHKIIGNDRIFPIENGKINKIPVYEKSNISMNPNQMEIESLADVWDLYRKNKPVIISQCYAVRASIGMAGHGKDYLPSIDLNKETDLEPDKDFVYWLSKKDLSWVTSQQQYALPEITKKFRINNYFTRQEINTYWKELDIDFKNIEKSFYKIVGSPLESILESEMLQSVIQTEIVDKGLHNDQETDLVYITFKAVDAVGHTHGWESEESRIVLEETDRQIGEILNFLEKNFNDDFAIVLTADHGAGPRMEFTGGHFYSYDELIEEIQFLLPPGVRKKENLVNFYTTGQISLNKEVMEKYNISIFQIQKSIEAIQVNNKKFFSKVLKRSDINNY
jgi:predicted AlkP superfamily pyrophosphatase or phosphodiesterase